MTPARYIYFLHKIGGPAPPPTPPPGVPLIYVLLRPRSAAPLPKPPGVPPTLLLLQRKVPKKPPGVPPILLLLSRAKAQQTADLLEAIAGSLNSNGTVSSLVPGGFWADSAPDGTPFPYGVVIEIAEAARFSSVDSSGTLPFIDDGQVQISIFVEGGKAAARSLGQQVENALNDAKLTFSKGYLMNLRRIHRTSALDPTKGPNGGDCWQRILTFNTSVGRSV